MKKSMTYITVLAILVLSFVGFAFSNQELLAQVVSFKVFVNSEEKTFKKPVVVIDGSTYISLREAGETLGMEVDWDGENDKIIIVNSNAAPVPFEENKRWGYKDYMGNVIVPPKYRHAAEFNDGMAQVISDDDGRRADLCGFINMVGEEVIPCTYFSAGYFKEGAAIVSLATHTDEDICTFIDKNGNRLFDKEFVSARNFSEGYAVVLKEGHISPLAMEKNQKWSYIDKTGDFVTELVFEEARSFKFGYALVKNNGKWGKINTNFELVVDYLYDDFNELS